MLWKLCEALEGFSIISRAYFGNLFEQRVPIVLLSRTSQYIIIISANRLLLERSNYVHADCSVRNYMYARGVPLYGKFRSPSPVVGGGIARVF